MKLRWAFQVISVVLGVTTVIYDHLMAQVKHLWAIAAVNQGEWSTYAVLQP
jgi:hypothetical protein